MKTRSLIFMMIILALFCWSIADAQTGAAKGKGRVRGEAVDEAGKPLAGVTVRFSCVRLETSFDLTTNEKGEWVAAGIAGENWNIDFIKEGYATQQISYKVQSLAHNKPVLTVMKRAAMAPPSTTTGSPTAPAAGQPVDPSKALIAEGSALADKKDYAGAIAKYEEAMKLKPEMYVLYGEIGNLYSQMNQPDQALASYEKLLEKDPANEDAMLAASSILFEKKDLAGAKKILSGLDLSKVSNPNTLYNLGVGFYNGQDTAEAIKYWEKAVELDPKMVDAYVQLGAAYLSMKQNDKSKAMFQKVLELDPDGDNGKMAKEMLDTMH